MSQAEGSGGSGWGGWSGAQTVEANAPRGMGVFASGAGYYNQQTAAARSINADTAARWNAYTYASTQKAARLRRKAKVTQSQAKINENQDQIYQRLRNHPSSRDVHQGDALNVAMDEISDPRVYSNALQHAEVKIGGEAIRDIPFLHAPAASKTSIHEITQGAPAAALLVPEFESYRTDFRKLGQELRDGLAKGETPAPRPSRRRSS